ncbi:CHRD domain-containing protein [Flavobacterium sp. LC2016-01]|uniref:CHRD domain-containing protein n=1 Tax=Flavobacterium sp. LC2016-01 TaxID=2675876 RepID=UPI0012BAB51C|nr:CHRD domain-containing protein [Flavobacterium sp. LC2016-01]MTH17613.1 CHRD domain-containing protein [Flavobacterium sp. LC2016-01]
MKSLLNFSAILLLFIGASCSSNDDDPTPPAPVIVTFNATLNGTSEVPANASTATGTATLSYNKTTKIFTLNVTYTGLTPTMGHIHKGAVGTSGPIVFPFTNITSPFSYTSAALTAEQETDLLANNYYVNLHTEAFTAGEIRGQLITDNPNGSGGGSGGGGGY